MNKKCIAMGVAGALALPLAAQADVVLQGNLHGSLGVIDNDDSTDFTTSNHLSVLSITGSHEISPGLEGIFEIGTNVATTGEGGDDVFFGSRDTYVGIEGGWGTLRYGIIDTAYEDSDDELANYGIGPDMVVDPRPDGISDWKAIMHSMPGDVGGSDDVFDVRAADTIEYASPNLNGFAFRVGYHGNSVESEANSSDLAGGQDDNDIAGVSASASYGWGPFGITYAYERQSYDDEPYGREWAGNTIASIDQPEAHNVILYYGNEAGLRLAASWETIDMDAVDTAGDSGYERDAWYLMAAQEFGPNLAYAKYAQADDLDGFDDTGADFWALGVQRDLSDQFQVYLEYAQTSNDDAAQYGFDSGGTGMGVAEAGDDIRGVTVGTVYAF